MTYQYGRNDMPNPQRPPKPSFISKVREKFKEKEPTREEIQKLALQAKKETLKTQIARAKSARPSRFSGFGSGESRPSGRRSRQQENSFLFGSPNQGSSFLDMGSGPSLDFITGNNSRQSGRGRKQDSGIGKGLSDMFT